MKLADLVTLKEPVRIRCRELANGRKSLYLDINSHGKRYCRSLKLYLIPEHCKTDRLQNQEMLCLANAIKAKEIIALQNRNYGFFSQNLSPVDLTDYIQQILADEKTRPAKKKLLRALCVHLTKFSGKSIPLTQINEEYITDFISYLRQINHAHCTIEKRLHPNTIVCYFKALRHVLNCAERANLIPNNPFLRLKYESIPIKYHTERAYLTFKELKRLANTPLVNVLLKRAFLFSCYSGLRHCDLISLKWQHIKQKEDGSTWLHITQQKTTTPLIIPLHPEAINLLPKPQKAISKDARVFEGLITLGRSNILLPQWAETAGIKKHITFHCARHTYATLLLASGADLYSISKLLGHIDIRTTQIYAQLIDESKQKTVSLLPHL